MQFIVLFVILGGFSFITKYDHKMGIWGFFANNSFLGKKKHFEDFFSEKDEINLIIGSSQIQYGVIPDSLGEKWYSFSSGGQTIYNSYKFLEYYSNSIKIDTIIIGFAPFDFPFSYRQKNYDYSNPYFIVFGPDSISMYPKHRLVKRGIQNTFNIIFPNLNNKFSAISQIVYGKQGFTAAVNAPAINMDSLYNSSPTKFDNHIDYFSNVKEKPNMKYFQLFHSFCQKEDIDVIYLLTPKSKFYNMNVRKVENDLLWSTIIDSLKRYDITIWDYEYLNTDSLTYSFFLDETHLSYHGALKFTSMIRERLYNDY